jgi:CheY-like chemotaxis protein
MINKPHHIHILLADDDEDDRTFFEEALHEFSLSAFLMTVNDGEKLMGVLSTLPSSPPPHVIFLDINMPLKNGIECLTEIRRDKKFDRVPIFMFSTSADKHDIDLTYENGANLYIPKALFFSDQKRILEKLFSVHWENYLSKIPKEEFVLRK